MPGPSNAGAGPVYLVRPFFLNSRVKFTRQGQKWYRSALGVYKRAEASIPTFDGVTGRLVIDSPDTANNLWSRDLTNAAWVKTNMTVEKTVNGLDGVTNTGNLLTATAANATILQPIVLASAVRSACLFIRRRTGSGTIQITLNGGTTWNTIVPTSVYTDYLVTATLANPSIGIRIVTSGDAIDVDFARIGNFGIATSPIESLGTATTRVSEGCTVSFSNNNALGTIDGCLVISGAVAGNRNIATFGMNQVPRNDLALRVDGGNMNLRVIHVVNGSSFNGPGLGAVTLGARSKFALSWAAGMMNGSVAARSGNAASVANTQTPTPLPGMSFGTATMEIEYLTWRPERRLEISALQSITGS